MKTMIKISYHDKNLSILNKQFCKNFLETRSQQFFKSLYTFYKITAFASIKELSIKQRRIDVIIYAK